MTLEDIILKHFDDLKLLNIAMIHQLVKDSNLEIASAIESLEKQGMIRSVGLGVWQRTKLDSINDWL